MKPMKLFCLAAAFALALAAQEPQGTLTNIRVANLVRLGVSTPEIARIIGSAPQVNFDLRPGSTDNLLKAGVSEEIIKAMAARETGAPQLAAVVSTEQKTPLRDTTAAHTRKLRVFIAQSNNSYAGASTHPQTVEVMKTFGESCPNLVVTNRRQNADYIVQFERESLKGLRKHNKFAAFNQNGDMVYSASTRAVGNAVRGFCSSLQKGGLQQTYVP